MNKKHNAERAKAIFSEVATAIDSNIDHKLSSLSYSEAVEKLTDAERRRWFKTFVEQNGTDSFEKRYWL
jgi:hypothetical protein